MRFIASACASPFLSYLLWPGSAFAQPVSLAYRSEPSESGVVSRDLWPVDVRIAVDVDVDVVNVRGEGSIRSTTGNPTVSLSTSTNAAICRGVTSDLIPCWGSLETGVVRDPAQKLQKRGSIIQISDFRNLQFVGALLCVLWRIIVLVNAWSSCGVSLYPCRIPVIGHDLGSHIGAHFFPLFVHVLEIFGGGPLEDSRTYCSMRHYSSWDGSFLLFLQLPQLGSVALLLKNPVELAISHPARLRHKSSPEAL